MSVTAAAGGSVLRHCDLNDLWQTVQRPSSWNRVVVVISD